MAILAVTLGAVVGVVGVFVLILLGAWQDYDEENEPYWH